MSDVARIGLGGEALPSPVSYSDTYLLAIFDELRALRLLFRSTIPGFEDASPQPLPAFPPEPAGALPEEQIPAPVPEAAEDPVEVPAPGPARKPPVRRTTKTQARRRRA